MNEGGAPSADYQRLWVDSEKEVRRLKKLRDDKERAKLEAEANERKAAALALEQCKRENDQLRKKIQELEPQLNMYDKVKADNEKLKLENGALIRVANKLNSKKINTV